MYTVIRFQSSPGKEELLKLFGERLNEKRPGMFDGLDRPPGRFSCSVFAALDWNAHVEAMVAFLDQFREIIRDARAVGIEIEFDAAIDPEDYACHKLCFDIDLPLKLVEQLAAHQVSINITYYLPQSGKQR